MKSILYLLSILFICHSFCQKTKKVHESNDRKTSSSSRDNTNCTQYEFAKDFLKNQDFAKRHAASTGNFQYVEGIPDEYNFEKKDYNTIVEYIENIRNLDPEQSQELFQLIYNKRKNFIEKNALKEPAEQSIYHQAIQDNKLENYLFRVDITLNELQKNIKDASFKMKHPLKNIFWKQNTYGFNYKTTAQIPDYARTKAVDDYRN